MGKMIIFSAPSGAGKSTVTRHLLKVFPQLEFSVSVTSRASRGNEREGVDYYFVTPEEFRRLVAEDKLIEWQEVYKDNFYGTLRSELDRIWAKGHVIVFDIDVKGGLNLKEMFQEQAMAVFIMPPSVEELRRRLTSRGTDTPEVIERRIDKATVELAYAQSFDAIIDNDDLDQTLAIAEKVVGGFINQ